MKISNKVLGISFIVTALVLVNGYLLLKNNDVILKSYYINNMQKAPKDIQQEELVKDAAVVSSMEHYIATTVNSISEVTVNKGQSITAFDTLATYKSEDAIAARMELENKLSAYETELSDLEDILYDLENEGFNSNPSTATDGTSFGTDTWNLDLTIELGIEQNTPTAEGIAIIQRHIAETNREIDILNSQIMRINEDNALTTPIDGIVSDIILEGDMITFVIQSSMKKLVTYVTKDEWLKVDIDEAATFTLFKGDEEREQEITGYVSQKQEIPARESLGYAQLLTHTDLQENDTVYEVSIEPNEFLDATPLGEIVEATIIVNEQYDSYETYTDWIVQYDIPDVGNEHVYTLGYDGKTRLTAITSFFEHNTAIDRNPKIEVVKEEAPVPEETTKEKVEEAPAPPRIQNVVLPKKQEEAQEEDDVLTDDATVFTAPLEDVAFILDGTEKNIYAPTHRPFPFQSFSKKDVGTFTWKNAIIYMMPQ